MNRLKELITQYLKTSSEDILNQWTTTAERWLPAGVWEECYAENTIEEGSDIILALMEVMVETQQL